MRNFSPERPCLHLRGFGIHEIYTDSPGNAPGHQAEYSRARPLLGKDWIAAFESVITRQSPVLLRKKAIAAKAISAVSLACSGRPWLHTAVLTDSRGAVQTAEDNPAPDNALTNLCFSGLVWVGDGGFHPEALSYRKGPSRFILPDTGEKYWTGKAFSGPSRYPEEGGNTLAHLPVPPTASCGEVPCQKIRCSGELSGWERTVQPERVANSRTAL